MKFGLWSVIGVGTQKRYLRCVCRCGTTREVYQSSLKSGASTSCGCYRTGNLNPSFKHGLSQSDEYSIWEGMKNRCFNINEPAYFRYGGRGITVCGRWLKFENFYTDMGPRPSKLYSLDRYPNRDGNYEPGNVRWATDVEQANNMNSNVRISAFGKTMTVAEWSRSSGLDPAAIHGRLRMGWGNERAVSEPSNPMSGRFLPRIRVTHEGRTLTVSEWSKESGLPRYVIKQRLKKGWEPGIAVSAPLRTQFSRSRS